MKVVLKIPLLILGFVGSLAFPILFDEVFSWSLFSLMNWLTTFNGLLRLLLIGAATALGTVAAAMYFAVIYFSLKISPTPKVSVILVTGYIVTKGIITTIGVWGKIDAGFTVQFNYAGVITWIEFCLVMASLGALSLVFEKSSLKQPMKA